jgi:hypothetical protein
LDFVLWINFPTEQKYIAACPLLVATIPTATKNLPTPSAQKIRPIFGADGQKKHK